MCSHTPATLQSHLTPAERRHRDRERASLEGPADPLLPAGTTPTAERYHAFLRLCITHEIDADHEALRYYNGYAHWLNLEALEYLEARIRERYAPVPDRSLHLQDENARLRQLLIEREAALRTLHRRALLWRAWADKVDSEEPRRASLLKAAADSIYGVTSLALGRREGER